MSFKEVIVAVIEKKGRGTIFFNTDFAYLKNDSYVRSVLTMLVKENYIVRLRKGIYTFPIFDDKHQMVIPSFHELANAISKRNKIVPQR